MRTFLGLLMALLYAPDLASGAHSFDEYLATFTAYAQHPYNNEYMPAEAITELAAVNWALARGGWLTARRLAAEQGAESQMRVLAWLPPGTDPKGMPRTDTMGSHYNLAAQELGARGVYHDGARWLHSAEFRRLKWYLTADPALGTWLVGTVFAKKARQVGLDRASHWWQTGKDCMPDPDDEYLNTVRQRERLFDSMTPEAQRKRASKKQRRKP